MSWINTQIVGSGPSPRGYHGSAVISDDRLILFGGMTTTKILNTKEKPLSDSPSKESTRKLLKTTSSSSYLSDSTPEVDEPVYLNDLWLFDNTKRAEDKWCMLEAKGDIPTRRAQHTMLGISDDRVVLFGGFDGTRYYNDLYVLDFKTLVWKRINAGGKDTPKARAGHIVAAFTGTLGTSMVIFGGKNDTVYFNDLFILDLKDWKWILALTSGDAPSPRAFASGSSIGTQLYIFGGECFDKANNKWEAYNDLFYINTTNMRWVKPELTSGSVAPTPRYSHSATLFNNGKTLLVFGGSSNRSGNLCDPSVFLFDAEHSKWLKCTVKSATSGDEPPARSMHTAQLLFGSKIVIFGGVKTECYANDDGYVMQNIYTNTVFIFYHLELIEPKKEVRKRQSKAGKIVSDAFDSIFKKDHHHSDKDKKKKRNSKKEEVVKEISRPYNAQRVRHVNFDLEWTGNPSEIFVLEEQLGKGSFGSVFKAKERETGYVMAIKEIELKQSTNELKNEIDILKKFNHNNVVKYFGSLVHGQKIWILMEYCALGSIRDLIETGDSPLNEDEIAFVTQHTLAGLTVLHTKKIIHRDVKAANILLTEEGQVKIADFGVSDTLGKANQSIGTPLWMAPEVIQKKDYDSRCDIWSLGITLIEMADGFPPHHKMPPMRAMMMVPLKEPPTVTEPSKWSTHFNDFVAKCLVKDPKTRPQAMDLLTHPFVTGNKTPQVLQEKIKKCMGIRAAKRQQTVKQQQEMTGTGTFGSTIGSTSGYGTGTGTGTGTGMHLSHSRNNSMTGPIVILKDAIDEKKKDNLAGSGSIKRSSTIPKEEEATSDIWSTTKTNTEMADTVDKFSTSVVNEDTNNNYGTSVMHEEVEQPPPAVRKNSKKTKKEKKHVEESEDAYGTSVMHEDVEQPPPEIKKKSKKTKKEKHTEKQVEKPVEKPVEEDIFSTSVVKDDEPAEDIYATSVQHDDVTEENTDIYATSVQHDEKEEENTDIYATSVQHDEPPAPKVTIKRKDSRKELPGEDIFATSVTHEDLPPKPIRKDSAKKEISPRLRDEITAGALSGSAPSASLNAADIRQIMEATNKAIKESEQRMLQALHDLRGEITNQMENANQITVYVENKKDRMAETTEALRTFVRDHLHEADQATLLNMISVLKKKKR